MKSLFKVTLLATTMAVALHAPITFAAEAAKPATTADSKAAFKNDDQKSAYALGASLGRYMENSLKEQEKLGIKLDKDQLIAGVQDAFADKSKLSDQEIEQTLQAFEARVKSSAQAKMEKDAADNEAKGKEYREKFAKEKGVKTSSTGLVYQVVEAGKGEAPKDSDTVVVNYKGTLIDGKEFDNSYTRGEPLSFRLDGVIPGNGRRRFHPPARPLQRTQSFQPVCTAAGPPPAIARARAFPANSPYATFPRAAAVLSFAPWKTLPT